MGLQVIDDKKILSKHQIQKIKNVVSEYIKSGGEKDATSMESFLTTHVLEKLSLPDGCSYNTVRYEENDNVEGEHDKIVFADDIQAQQAKTKLKTSLRDRLRQKSYLRKNSDDDESRKWKKYEHLKRFVQKNIHIPTPTEVVQQRAVFQEMLEKMPNSEFKVYVEGCLSS
jgi:hypothetical protein